MLCFELVFLLRFSPLRVPRPATAGVAPEGGRREGSEARKRAGRKREERGGEKKTSLFSVAADVRCRRRRFFDLDPPPNFFLKHFTSLLKKKKTFPNPFFSTGPQPARHGHVRQELVGGPGHPREEAGGEFKTPERVTRGARRWEEEKAPSPSFFLSRLAKNSTFFLKINPDRPLGRPAALRRRRRLVQGQLDQEEGQVKD